MYIMVDYYQKYIKYKMKYLYEKMSGGALTPYQKKKIIELLNDRQHEIKNLPKATDIKIDDTFDAEKFVINYNDLKIDTYLEAKNYLQYITESINKHVGDFIVTYEIFGRDINNENIGKKIEAIINNNGPNAKAVNAAILAKPEEFGLKIKKAVISPRK